MLPAMVEVGQTLLKQFSKIEETETVELKDFLKNAALDIIGRYLISQQQLKYLLTIRSTAFGVKFDSLGGTESELVQAVKFDCMIPPHSHTPFLSITPLYFFFYYRSKKYLL